MCLQQLTNTGTKALSVPYTLAIYSPSYALIAGQAWNWGASGSATNGTFSGPVSMVRMTAVLFCNSAADPCHHSASLVHLFAPAVPSPVSVLEVPPQEEHHSAQCM